MHAQTSMNLGHSKSPSVPPKDFQLFTSTFSSAGPLPMNRTKKRPISKSMNNQLSNSSKLSTYEKFQNKSI